jgi:hypothetical protein
MLITPDAIFAFQLDGAAARARSRLGLYMINVTNHGNFTEVYNNVASPQVTA